MRRLLVRVFLSVSGAAAFFVAASTVLAVSGPPQGRVEIEQAPPPPPPARPPSPAPPPSPPDAGMDGGAGAADAAVAIPGAPPDAAPSAADVAIPPVTTPTAAPPAPPPPEAPAQTPTQTAPVGSAQPRMPTIQRPDQPIETTAVPGEVTPQTPDAAKVTDGLDYVRGLRYILSGHRENYFISGLTSAQHLVKFQYSAKFDLWPNATRHSAYFGFTQKSLWRLWDFENSSPFDESNYAPEVFYGYYTKIGDIVPRPGTVDWFVESARAGLEHESNGAEGPRSRSWNRIYARVQAGAYLGTNHYVMATPRAWLPPFGDWDNENIEEYLGLGALSLEYGYDPVPKSWYGGGNITATFMKGLHRDLDRHSIEIALQWRPAYEGRFLEWWKFTPFFYLQIFRGYGETLLQYDQKVSVLRFGISFEDRVNWITLPRRRTSR